MVSLCPHALCPMYGRDLCRWSLVRLMFPHEVAVLCGSHVAQQLVMAWPGWRQQPASHKAFCVDRLDFAVKGFKVKPGILVTLVL